MNIFRCLLEGNEMLNINCKFSLNQNSFLVEAYDWTISGRPVKASPACHLTMVNIQWKKKKKVLYISKFNTHLSKPFCLLLLNISFLQQDILLFHLARIEMSGGVGVDKFFFIISRPTLDFSQNIDEEPPS